MSLSLKVVRKDAPQRIAYGWAYVAKTADGHQVIDWSGEFVDDPAVLEKALHEFVKCSRAADVMHDGEQVGQLVEAIVFTAEKRAAMGIPEGAVPDGVWIGVELPPDVWKRVESGELTMFSIGGTCERETVAA